MLSMVNYSKMGKAGLEQFVKGPEELDFSMKTMGHLFMNLNTLP